jgi:hypothetical protein
MPDEQFRNIAGLDTDKETTSHSNSNTTANGDHSPEAVPNDDSNKELLPRGDEEKEASNPESHTSGESNADPKDVDDTEYPSGFKLLLITIALCLCVFCVALVRLLLGTQWYTCLPLNRTTQLLQRPFPKSPISSTLLTMWVGMEVPTC